MKTGALAQLFYVVFAVCLFEGGKVKRTVMYMLQVNLFLRSICSNLGQFVSTWVNLFQPRSICFNLGQFDFFCFCGKQKNIFGTFDLLFILLLLFISTLLTSPTIPSLLFQHPNLYSFYLNAYLGSLEPQTFGFPLDSCLMPYQWAMQNWMQVPLYF